MANPLDASTLRWAQYGSFPWWPVRLLNTATSDLPSEQIPVVFLGENSEGCLAQGKLRAVKVGFIKRYDRHYDRLSGDGLGPLPKLFRDGVEEMVSAIATSMGVTPEIALADLRSEVGVTGKRAENAPRPPSRAKAAHTSAGEAPRQHIPETNQVVAEVCSFGQALILPRPLVDVPEALPDSVALPPELLAAKERGDTYSLHVAGSRGRARLMTRPTADAIIETVLEPGVEDGAGEEAIVLAALSTVECLAVDSGELLMPAAVGKLLAALCTAYEPEETVDGVVGDDEDDDEFASEERSKGTLLQSSPAVQAGLARTLAVMRRCYPVHRVSNAWRPRRWRHLERALQAVVREAVAVLIEDTSKDAQRQHRLHVSLEVLNHLNVVLRQDLEVRPDASLLFSLLGHNREPSPRLAACSRTLMLSAAVWFRRLEAAADVARSGAASLPVVTRACALLSNTLDLVAITLSPTKAPPIATAKTVRAIERKLVDVCCRLCKQKRIPKPGLIAPALEGAMRTANMATAADICVAMATVMRRSPSALLRGSAAIHTLQRGSLTENRRAERARRRGDTSGQSSTDEILESELRPLKVAGANDPSSAHIRVTPIVARSFVLRRSSKQAAHPDTPSIISLPTSSEAPAVIIGRSRECGARLVSFTPEVNQNISRRHAIVRATVTGDIQLIDNRSAGGVFVNWRRIRPETAVELALGDVVAFGGGASVPIDSFKTFETEFRFVLEVSASKERCGSEVRVEDKSVARVKGKRKAADFLGKGMKKTLTPQTKSKRRAKSTPLGLPTRSTIQSSILNYIAPQSAGKS